MTNILMIFVATQIYSSNYTTANWQPMKAQSWRNMMFLKFGVDTLIEKSESE